MKIVFFIVDSVTGTARSITIRVAALNHESRNNTVKHKTVVEPLIRKFNKVRYGIRSGLEVQVHHDFSLMGCNFGKNLGNTRIILVKNFSRSKSICGKAQGTANNEFSKQNLTSVVIPF